MASYVLADGYPYISEETLEHLREVTTANGRSESDLIYDANGEEHQSASRRVVFKFRLTDEQMVAQLQTILEGGTAAQQPSPRLRPPPRRRARPRRHGKGFELNPTDLRPIREALPYAGRAPASGAAWRERL